MTELNNCPDSSKRISDLTSQDSSIQLKKQKFDTNPENYGKEEHPLTKDDVVLQQYHQEVEEKEERKEEKEIEEEDRLNGEPVIDRKGKGILVEEDEDEDDDDDSGIGGDEFSDDSDFVDDPLAEVNLDNILPSRTRRKTINPGAYLATDLPDNDDDDDSDDPDA